MSESVSIDEARRLAKAAKRTSLQDKFLAAWKATGWPMPEAEYRFHPVRKWRFDFAWPALMLAVECNGGEFIGGRHSRATARVSEYDKLNEAIRLGWRVLQFGTLHCKAMDDVVRTVQEVMAELSKRKAV